MKKIIIAFLVWAAIIIGSIIIGERMEKAPTYPYYIHDTIRRDTVVREPIVEKESWRDWYIKENGLYWDAEKNWQKEQYGFYPRGLFDVIYNTMRKIIEDGDHSEWAHSAIDTCSTLLQSGIRYPVSYIPDNMAKNRLDLAWNKLMHAEGKNQKYGPICKLTRDPYIYLFTACAIMDREEVIVSMTIPWYLYRPLVWQWHKYLKNPTLKNLKHYERMENRNHPRKEFVKNLQRYRRLAVNLYANRYKVR